MSGNTVTVEFIGGSRDGGVIEAKEAPGLLTLNVSGSWVEIYQRQTEEPPYVYEQIGYCDEQECF